MNDLRNRLAHKIQLQKEAQQQIKQLTQIKRSVSRVKVFLHKLGRNPRKTAAALPAKVDPVDLTEAVIAIHSN